LHECRATVVVGEIKQVVANILANAIDASSSGGKITVKVVGSETHVTILVEDTGSGIAPANASHLFEPFFTTKESVGTGLGLWVSKQIVERHHGSIKVENRDDVESGARITVRLPLHAWGVAQRKQRFTADNTDDVDLKDCQNWEPKSLKYGESRSKGKQRNPGPRWRDWILGGKCVVGDQTLRLQQHSGLVKLETQQCRVFTLGLRAVTKLFYQRGHREMEKNQGVPMMT
jgi:anti-sigma regulatory factor (Ser/Thr protein kinase)